MLCRFQLVVLYKFVHMLKNSFKEQMYNLLLLSISRQQVVYNLLLHEFEEMIHQLLIILMNKKKWIVRVVLLYLLKLAMQQFLAIQIHLRMNQLLNRMKMNQLLKKQLLVQIRIMNILYDMILMILVIHGMYFQQTIICISNPNYVSLSPFETEVTILFY